jgi:hypothetical protein
MFFRRTPSAQSLSLLTVLVCVAGCVSYPTLVEIARTRQNPDKSKDLSAYYHITDRDVLDYTDRIKILLSSKLSSSSFTRYSSSTTQITLATLAGAAATAGWSVAAASGLGMGSAFISGLGQSIDAKGHAQAYEQALTAVQSAESTFYFRQVGLSFGTDASGRSVVVRSGVNNAASNDIPSTTKLTPDGETLYYRVTKVLKVLDDVLASKIPDLQDLKDAKGDWTSSPGSPAGHGETIKGPNNSPRAPAPKPNGSVTPSASGSVKSTPTPIVSLPTVSPTPTASGTATPPIMDLPPVKRSPTPGQ